jgi:hypothetical protein
MNQYNGYDLRTYDILGRLTGMVSDNRDLMEQRVTKKELSFFKGFKGFVKSLLVTTERRELPMAMPTVDLKRGKVYHDDRCLVYLKFELENLQYTVNRTQQIINYCFPYNSNYYNLTILSPQNPTG